MDNNFLTFEQWKIKTGAREGDYYVPCPSCEGTGIAKEIYRHNCMWCGGSGLSGDLEDLYSYQKGIDLNLLMLWSGGSNANN